MRRHQVIAASVIFAKLEMVIALDVGIGFLGFADIAGDYRARTGDTSNSASLSRITFPQAFAASRLELQDRLVSQTDVPPVPGVPGQEISSRRDPSGTTRSVSLVLRSQRRISQGSDAVRHPHSGVRGPESGIAESNG